MHVLSFTGKKSDNPDNLRFFIFIVVLDKQQPPQQQNQ